jgi:hypothetical protein
MAEKEFEADDPYEFVAVRFPVAEGVDADALMARTFIEEFALMGMGRQKMLQLFHSPFFAGTNAILESRGEAFVKAIIEDVYGPAVLQEA